MLEDKTKPDTRANTEKISKILTEIRYTRQKVDKLLLNYNHKLELDTSTRTELLRLLTDLDDLFKRLSGEIRRSKSKKSMFRRFALDLFKEALYYRIIFTIANREKLEALANPERIIIEENPLYKYFTGKEITILLLEIASSGEHLEYLTRYTLVHIERNYQINYLRLFIHEAPELKTELNQRYLKKIIDNYVDWRLNRVINPAGLLYLLLFANPQRREEVSNFLTLKKITDTGNPRIKTLIKYWNKAQSAFLLYDAIIKEDREKLLLLEKAFKNYIRRNINAILPECPYTEDIRKGLVNLLGSQKLLLINEESPRFSRKSHIQINKRVKDSITELLTSEFVKLVNLCARYIDELHHIADILKEQSLSQQEKETIQKLNLISKLLSEFKELDFIINNLSACLHITCSSFFRVETPHTDYITIIEQELRQENTEDRSLKSTALAINDPISPEIEAIKNNLINLFISFQKDSLDDTEFFNWLIMKSGGMENILPPEPPALVAKRARKYINLIIHPTGITKFQRAVNLRKDLTSLLKEKDYFCEVKKKIEKSRKLSPFLKYYITGNAKKLFDPLKDKSFKNSYTGKKESSPEEKLLNVLSFIILEELLYIITREDFFGYFEVEQLFFIKGIKYLDFNHKNLGNLVSRLALFKVLTGRNLLKDMENRDDIKISLEDILAMCLNSARKIIALNKKDSNSC